MQPETNAAENSKDVAEHSLPFNYVSHRNNMTAVRYYLSFCVLIAHVSVLTGINFPWIQRGTVDVGCFFAISGFLMFPSFQKRRSFKHYIRRRALRILPAYLFIILLCAIGFCAISSCSASDYFTGFGFWKYLAANVSTLNFLHPSLPGVFEGDRFVTDAVNGSLWTMKGEWVCYLSVPFVFWLISRNARRGGIILLSVLVVSVTMRYVFTALGEVSGSVVFNIIAKQFGTLLVFFYIGALINFYYDKFLKYKWWILAFDIVVLIFSDSIPGYSYFFQPVVAGSLIIWLSMIGKWGTALSHHDSISYDIYLFHFPIIQLAIYFNLPSSVPPIVMLLIITVATVALAYTSWNLIGKRFNRMYR